MILHPSSKHVDHRGARVTVPCFPSFATSLSLSLRRMSQQIEEHTSKQTGIMTAFSSSCSC
jgi:predicted oxidoreductase